MSKNEKFSANWSLIHFFLFQSFRQKCEAVLGNFTYFRTVSLVSTTFLFPFVLVCNHWIWVNSGGCNVDATFLKSLGDALLPTKDSSKSLSSMRHKMLSEPWRIKVVEYLKQRNGNEIDRYKSFNQVNDSDVGFMLNKLFVL